MAKLTENIVEQATLEWLSELGYTSLNGSELAPDAPHPQRQNYNDVILVDFDTHRNTYWLTFFGGHCARYKMSRCALRTLQTTIIKLHNLPPDTAMPFPYK